MEKHSSLPSRSHSQQHRLANEKKLKLEHNCGHTDLNRSDNRSRVSKSRPEKQRHQYKEANQESSSSSSKNSSRFKVCNDHKKRERERYGNNTRQRSNQHHRNHSRSSTSTSTSSSGPTSTASSSSSSSSSASSCESSYSGSARTRPYAHSHSRSHLKPNIREQAETKRDKSRESYGGSKKSAVKPYDKLPERVLESISDYVLGYTKELGLFDELRMKLLDDFEASEEFQVIKDNFNKEVGAFCQHNSVDLASSRTKLREQLNDSCHRGDFKSAERLGDKIGYIISEYEHELRQRFDEKSDELQEQIMSQFNCSSHQLPSETIITPSQPPFDTSNSSYSYSSSSSSSPQLIASLASSTNAESLARLELQPQTLPLTPYLHPTEITERQFQDEPKVPPSLILSLPVATPRAPADFSHSLDDVQQVAASDQVTVVRRPAHVVAVVANIPTPSPSISPSEPPPTPPFKAVQIVASSKRDRFGSQSPSQPKIGGQGRDTCGRYSSTTAPNENFARRQNRLIETEQRDDRRDQQQRQPNEQKRWRRIKKKRERRRERNKASGLEAGRKRSNFPATTTGSNRNRWDRRKGVSPVSSNRDERRRYGPNPANRKQVVETKRIDSDDNNNTTTKNIDNSNKQIAIKMKDEDITHRSREVNQHLIRSR